MKVIIAIVFTLFVLAGFSGVTFYMSSKSDKEYLAAIHKLENTLMDNAKEAIELRQDLDAAISAIDTITASQAVRYVSLPTLTHSSDMSLSSKDTPQREKETDSSDQETSTTIDASPSAENRIASLEAEMLLQEEDLAMETSAKDDIQRFFSKLDTDGLRLEDVYCSGLMCRFELSYQDASQLDGLLFAEDAIVPWSHKGQSFVLDEHGGNPRTVYYLTRK